MQTNLFISYSFLSLILFLVGLFLFEGIVWRGFTHPFVLSFFVLLALCTHMQTDKHEIKRKNGISVVNSLSGPVPGPFLTD